ncbi:MAG: DMT family transporter [Patescibacteria group bacterium]
MPSFHTIRLSPGFKFSLMASLSWAISIVLTRTILTTGGENAYTLAYWSTILATPFWGYMLLRNKKEVTTLKKGDLYLFIIMGLIGTIGVSIVQSLALASSNAINYAFLIRTVTVFTILFAAVLLRERMTNKKGILVTLTILGAYLLTTEGQSLKLTTGDLFILLQAILLALNTILGKIATNRMSANVSAAGRFFASFLPFTLITWYQQGLQAPHAILPVLLLTGVSIVVTTTLFQAFKHASASYVTMIMSFTPVFVSIISIPLLHETLSTMQILGGIFIIGAGVAAEKLKI